MSAVRADVPFARSVLKRAHGSLQTIIANRDPQFPERRLDAGQAPQNHRRVEVAQVANADDAPLEWPEASRNRYLVVLSGNRPDVIGAHSGRQQNGSHRD